MVRIKVITQLNQVRTQVRAIGYPLRVELGILVRMTCIEQIHSLLHTSRIRSIIRIIQNITQTIRLSKTVIGRVVELLHCLNASHKL